MSIVVITAEEEIPHESRVIRDLFAAGLARLHVRRTGWTEERLRCWILKLPAEVKPRLVLHQHHRLAVALGLGGVHWRDDGTAPEVPDRSDGLVSRSCHNLESLRRSLGHYDSVFFGPVFPSISKQGHVPDATVMKELAYLLRTTDRNGTEVIALGGITAESAPRALAMGFDGVALLGAVWSAPDPVRAYSDVQSAIAVHVI
jgi:thiamine-phosphate pyrophosphorylase